MPNLTLIELLWNRTWWSYQPSDPDVLTGLLHWFNLAEGMTWVVFAALVLIRRQTGGRSTLEAWYALAFLGFGLTDFREAYVLTSWLIWIKLVNLIVLARLRSSVIRRFYPSSRLY
jgi:hypothetical protein